MLIFIFTMPDIVSGLTKLLSRSLRNEEGSKNGSECRTILLVISDNEYG